MSRRLRTRRIVNKKDNKKILLHVGIIFLFVMLFSVIFSLLNMSNNKIIKGVKYGKIDLSNLTQEEATKRIEDWYTNTVLRDISVNYNELEENISIEQLDPDLDIDKIVIEACYVGKSGNIIKDNYEILFTMILGKKINKEIELNEEEIDKKISELNHKLPDSMEESNYYIEDNNLIITKGKNGIQIENEKFKELLEEIIIEKDNRNFIIPVKQSIPKTIDIEQIYEEIHKIEKDAYISKNPLEVHPEINGVDFAISKDEAKKILEKDKEEYSIPLTITIPEITLEKLGKEAFPQLLGTFSTTYSAANENREINLKLASEKVDGTIILPGETFSYNKIVGQRTIAKGYKEAAVYSGGKVVDGIGGGICQLSSTLYNAAIYANLEITQRSNHQFLTSYVTAGRDATVSWGTLDFCFKNTRKYPIKVISIVKNGVVTTAIYGIKEEKEYEIEIENKIIEIIPYTTNYIKDSSLEYGAEEIKQNGANGAKSITYKIVKENGIIISKTMLSTDTYSPLEKIIRIGTQKVKDVNSDSVLEKQDQDIMNELNPGLLELLKEL